MKDQYTAKVDYNELIEILRIQTQSIITNLEKVKTNLAYGELVQAILTLDKDVIRNFLDNLNSAQLRNTVE